MENILEKKNSFDSIYASSYRLAAAIFAIFNLVDNDHELKTKVKSLSLDIVSKSVELKNLNGLETRKIVLEIEKRILLLMSFLDIASMTNLISEMNGKIVKEEFGNFMKELKMFIVNFENNDDDYLKNILTNKDNIKNIPPKENFLVEQSDSFVQKNYQNQNNIKMSEMKLGKTNGSRKDSRKSMILSFIKGHDNVSIKDIVPNIIGCSEKTVQRELIDLINEGKIIKTGERRWSRYSISTS